MNASLADLPDDPRLLQAVQEFMAELDAGRKPNRDAFLARYPDLAGPLSLCLEGLDLVHRATPAKAPSPDETAPSRPFNDAIPASPLGDFQIISEVGRGGMGIVYEAVQLSLARRVALKVLPFAATFDSKHLQRFHNEAHAAAQLHHTNIVPVHAVGCERGTHFYAMQLIDGQSLATMIRHLRQQSGRPDLDAHASAPRGEPAKLDTLPEASAALSTQKSQRPREFFRTAARFLVQAADGVEHAHQFGIVHRDIKPANLLVDERSRLWITDFGLAQFHADAGVTQTGDIVGTLRYMSPEQASGRRAQVDHRTDIYALGATLYELVTLEPIFPGNTRQEILHQIENVEPRAPRTLDKSIPVELETIILKAVSKHPADRYASAQAFAADLQRFLDDQPIQARRPSTIDRARKWARRHPGIVAASLLLMVLCTTGLLINNRMIAHEQAKTEAALKNEKQRAAEARRAVDLLVQVAEEELATHGALQGVRRRLLETALEYYQDYLETHGDDPAAKEELTASKGRVRGILDELAALQGAHLLGLTNDKAVITDLKLSETQRTQLTDLHERSSKQRMDSFREHRQLAPEDRRHKAHELAKSQETALNGILTNEQLQRLRQIELQMMGTRAFLDSPRVEQTLKLSVEQKRRIREVKEEMLAASFGPFAGSPAEKGGPFEFGKRQKTEMDRVLAILTPEQEKQWRDLIGPAFQPTRRPPPGGSFGKGPPFGRPG